MTNHHRRIMVRSIATICALLLLGSFAAAEAATINIGYVIVVASPDDFATLNLAMRTDDYPNPMYPVITNVRVTQASAQLYKGLNPEGTPLPWDASSLNPLTSDSTYSLMNDDGFFLGQGVTRAVITFTVEPLGPWDLRSQPDFSPTLPLQYTVEINNGGSDLVNFNYADLQVTGDFLSTPEPATAALTCSALAGVFLAVLRRKKL
jgi:hypothetical protein